MLACRLTVCLVEDCAHLSENVVTFACYGVAVCQGPVT